MQLTTLSLCVQCRDLHNMHHSHNRLSLPLQHLLNPTRDEAMMGLHAGRCSTVLVLGTSIP